MTGVRVTGGTTNQTLKCGPKKGGRSFAYLEEISCVFRGDTLDELAGKLGIDYATLQTTAEDFNALVDSGDDPLGRTLFSCKLETGPWVAAPRQTSLHHTMAA